MTIMRSVYKPDGPSDGIMDGPKQKAFHSPSPFGTLKEFGSHLSKVFGLGDSQSRNRLSHPGDNKELFASFDPESTDRGKHRPRIRRRERSWDPLNCYGTPFCRPGPSTPEKQVALQRASVPSAVADEKGSPRPFTEIHQWWLEEIKLIMRFHDNRLELDFLPEDSLLKGKEVAVWRTKVPEAESEHLPLALPCPHLRPPEKTFRGWAMTLLEGNAPQPVHHKEERHHKAAEIRLQDGRRDMILRIEPRLKLRR